MHGCFCYSPQLPGRQVVDFKLSLKIKKIIRDARPACPQSPAQATASPRNQFTPFTYYTSQLTRTISKPRYFKGEPSPPYREGVCCFIPLPRQGQTGRKRRRQARWDLLSTSPPPPTFNPRIHLGFSPAWRGVVSAACTE